MATIVANQPPYDPWREKLAGMLLEPLFSGLGDQIFGGQQRRKESAFAAEIAKSFSQPPQQMDYSMSTPTMDRFRNHINDYEGDMMPWGRNALGGASPLSEQMPSRMPWEVFGNKSSNPSIADILAGVDQKRFGGLGFDTQMKILNPMYEEQQQKAQRAKVQQWLDGFSSYSQDGQAGAGNFIDLFAKLLPGAVHGAIDSSMMGHALGGYRHDNPQPIFGSFDTGDAVRPYFVTPTPNSPRLQMLDAIAKGQSPDSRASTAVQRERNAIESRRQYGTPFIDADGNVHLPNQFTGEMKGVPDVKGTPRQQESVGDEIKRLMEVRKRHFNNYGDIRRGHEAAVKQIDDRIDYLMGFGQSGQSEQYYEMDFDPETLTMVSRDKK